MTAADPFTLVNATLPDRPGRWRLRIEDGVIAELNEGASAPHGVPAWDVEGRLVSAAFADPHVHVDKTLIADRVGDVAAREGLPAAVRAIRALKRDFSIEDVAARSQRALAMGLAHGTLHVRTNCEVDRFVEFRALEGLRRTARAMQGQLDVQIIAFPQEGWFDTEGTLESGAGAWVERAVSTLGVAIAGGNVNRCLWPSDPQAQVDALIALAARTGCDIDMHLDNWDSAEAFALPEVARKTLAQGLQGRVAVSHIPSLACVSDSQAADTIDLVRQADLQVCVLPTRMRLTRVCELIEAGVNVACGTDNLRDPFVRFGDADPLRALLLLAQLTGYLANADLERLWHCATAAAARFMRLPGYGIACGHAAHLMVLDATSVPDAILLQSSRLAVYRGGRQVAGTIVAPVSA